MALGPGQILRLQPRDVMLGGAIYSTYRLKLNSFLKKKLKLNSWEYRKKCCTGNWFRRDTEATHSIFYIMNVGSTSSEMNRPRRSNCFARLIDGWTAAEDQRRWWTVLGADTGPTRSRWKKWKQILKYIINI
jgi:hypothetical protein